MLLASYSLVGGKDSVQAFQEKHKVNYVGTVYNFEYSLQAAAAMTLIS